MQRFQKAKCFLAVFLLVISLFVGILPANASFAAVVADGTFGEDNNLTWVLDNTGLLSISGKGKMQDKYVQDYPWYSYADQITAVRIQNGVQNVGTYMFEEYDNLETVEIGESVLVIGKYSFNFCDNLRSVTIPKSLRRVDEQAFFMCPLLSDVHIADASLWCGIEFMSDHANPLCNGADLLADGEIVTEVTVPDFVTTLGNFQFYGCQSLEKIKLHADVTVIGTAAFGNCPSLRAIYCEKADDQIHKILDTNSELSKELFVVSPDEQDKITDGDVIEKDGVLYSADMTVLRGFTENVAAELVVPETVTKIADGAFRNCFALQAITLPDTVTELPDSLFENCRNLQRVIFSDKLTAIGSRTFSGCIRLAEIKIPDTVSEIGDYAFSSCRSFRSVTLPTAIKDLSDGVFADCVRMTEMQLPENLQSIGNNAFYNCYNLKEILLPETVTSLGTCVFYGCAALTKVVLPDGIVELPEQTFYQCYGLKEVVYPDTLQGIGRYAFYDCIALSALHLPDSLLKIGEYAFFGCESLTEIVLPPAVTQIEDSTFKACLFLAKITLPEKLESIGSEAFRYCQTLDAVYLPASLQSLDSTAFDQCYYLKKIYFGGDKQQWIVAYPDSIPENREVIFEHTHTAGKWDVIVYPTSENEGFAKRNCELCHAVQTANMGKTMFAGNEKATVNMEGYLSVVAQFAAAELLQQAGDGAVLTDADGEVVSAEAVVGTGMTLTLADGTGYTVLVTGDCDGNGQINAEDARLTLRLSVGLEDFATDSVQYRACDADDFTGVTSSDARSILRASVGLDDPNDWKR